MLSVLLWAAKNWDNFGFSLVERTDFVCEELKVGGRIKPGLFAGVKLLDTYWWVDRRTIHTKGARLVRPCLRQCRINPKKM